MDIFSGVAVAKQAYELVKVIMESRDQAVIDKAAGALQEKITELQMLNAELSSLFHAERQITVELREENAKINMFTTQSSEYEIHKTSAGSIVYILKSTPKGEIPHHYLCAHCYENRIISTLHPCDSRSEFIEHFCPQCQNKYRWSFVHESLKCLFMCHPYHHHGAFNDLVRDMAQQACRHAE